MNNEKHLMPAEAVNGIGLGLMLMGFFTCIWTGIAFGGLYGNVYALALIVFPGLAFYFIIKALSLYKIAKYFPKLTTEADKAEEKKMGMWFGIIFGAEGLGIFIGINVVTNLGHSELTVPVIALVVALHFFPLAWLFKRRVDYYLATWSTIIAVLGMMFALNKTFSHNYVIAFVGVGIAMATSCYGIYMLYQGRRAERQLSAFQGN